MAIAITTIIVGVGVYVVTSGPLMSGFANLEDRRAREDVLRVDQTLGQMVQQVHAKSVDWSNWDDTYQFMKDRNSTYLHSNMVVASFMELKIDAVILLDSSHDVFYSLSVPRLKGFPLIDAQAIKNELAEGGWLNKLPSNGEGKGGVLMFKGLPLAVSIRPI